MNNTENPRLPTAADAQRRLISSDDKKEEDDERFAELLDLDSEGLDTDDGPALEGKGQPQ